VIFRVIRLKGSEKRKRAVGDAIFHILVGDLSAHDSKPDVSMRVQILFSGHSGDPTLIQDHYVKVGVTHRGGSAPPNGWR
jgi:hypothetical protein